MSFSSNLLCYPTKLKNFLFQGWTKLQFFVTQPSSSDDRQISVCDLKLIVYEHTAIWSDFKDLCQIVQTRFNLKGEVDIMATSPTRFQSMPPIWMTSLSNSYSYSITSGVTQKLPKSVRALCIKSRTMRIKYYVLTILCYYVSY